MATRNIAFYIDSSDSLRKLAGESRRLDELQQVFLKTVPAPLVQGCRVGIVRGETLFLLADSGAIAAKLRQLTPRLLTSFRKLRGEITSIQIRVQVDTGNVNTQAAGKKRSLSTETINNLGKLSDGLDDTPLKTALQQLMSRHRGTVK